MPTSNSRRSKFKCSSVPGYRFGDRALFFDPDSDPEQEISVWTRQRQGEIFRLNSTKRTLQRTKALLPALLGSRPWDSKRAAQPRAEKKCPVGRALSTGGSKPPPYGS